METQAQIVTRWRYLRALLIEQLANFESGKLTIHEGAENVSAAAIERLKREIDDFDGLIAVSDRRDAQRLLAAPPNAEARATPKAGDKD